MYVRVVFITLSLNDPDFVCASAFGSTEKRPNHHRKGTGKSFQCHGVRVPSRQKKEWWKIGTASKKKVSSLPTQKLKFLINPKYDARARHEVPHHDFPPRAMRQNEDDDDHDDHSRDRWLLQP